MTQRSELHEDVTHAVSVKRCLAALKPPKMPIRVELLPDMLIAEPYGLKPCGVIVLLHGRVATGVEVLAEGDAFPPGIWGVAGTALELARRGWKVVCPEQAEFWDAELVDRLAPHVASETVIVMGFSFGGTAATELVAYHWPRITGVVLLDPSAWNVDSVRTAQPKMACPVVVLLAGQAKARMSRSWAQNCPNAVELVVENADHADMVRPFGVLGDVMATMASRRRVATGAAVLAADALAHGISAISRLCPPA